MTTSSYDGGICDRCHKTYPENYDEWAQVRSKEGPHENICKPCYERILSYLEAVYEWREEEILPKKRRE